MLLLFSNNNYFETLLTAQFQIQQCRKRKIRSPIVLARMAVALANRREPVIVERHQIRLATTLDRLLVGLSSVFCVENA